MDIKQSGRKSRKSRLVENNSGAWGSSSQDFVRLANLLFAHSLAYAKQADGNCSIYAFSGIPTLFSALRCLLIEVNASMYSACTDSPQRVEMVKIEKTNNDIQLILDHYPVSENLREKLKLLVQVRHEIIHPAHRPSREKNNTPSYLSQLRQEDLLQSSGNESDYIWLSQLQSHKLFRWAFQVVEETVQVILSTHRIEENTSDGLLASYSKYRQYEEDI